MVVIAPLMVLDYVLQRDDGSVCSPRRNLFHQVDGEVATDEMCCTFFSQSNQHQRKYHIYLSAA